MRRFSLPMFLAACLLVPVAGCQQTIFNVPSPDVLDRGKVYAELDISWRPYQPRFSAFVPRIVTGAGHRIEIGINLPGNIQPGHDHTTLVPNLKWKAYDGKENGWAWLVGDELFLPLVNRTYDVGNYAYTSVARSFSRGTRLAAGIYHFSPNVAAAGAQRAGGQFSVEQSLPRNLTLAADWYTGKQAFGYLTPGVIWKAEPHVTIYFGYSLGNQGLDHGNHYFLTELGINLN